MSTAISLVQAKFRGSIVKEYMLVVRPQDSILEHVSAEKINFSGAYRFAEEQQTGHDIVIARFLAKEEMEETILRWMQRILGTKNTFQVALNNYGGQPGSNIIFLRIQDHLPFKRLSKELKVIDELVKSNGLPGAQLIANPHLPVVENLGNILYDRALMDYSKREFHTTFEVSEFILLKRTNQFHGCQQVSVFRLQP